jgi:hypothetical protein
MPKKLFFGGQLQSTIKGDDAKATKRVGLLGLRRRAVDLNGHTIEFRKAHLTAAVTIPEAEWQAGIAKAEAEKKAQEAAAAEAKAKADLERAASLEKASKAFIDQHGPDPANWPEHLRPKPPAVN